MNGRIKLLYIYWVEFRSLKMLHILYKNVVSSWKPIGKFHTLAYFNSQYEFPYGSFLYYDFPFYLDLHLKCVHTCFWLCIHYGSSSQFGLISWAHRGKYINTKLSCWNNACSIFMWFRYWVVIHIVYNQYQSAIFIGKGLGFGWIWKL